MTRKKKRKISTNLKNGRNSVVDGVEVDLGC